MVLTERKTGLPTPTWDELLSLSQSKTEIKSILKKQNIDPRSLVSSKDAEMLLEENNRATVEALSLLQFIVDSF